MTVLWECETCRERFQYTTGAIEHAAANQQADIWPVHS